MCSFDLPDADLRKKFISHVLELGAILLGCGEKSIRLRPSLTFSKENVNELMGIIEKAINRL